MTAKKRLSISISKHSSRPKDTPSTNRIVNRSMKSARTWQLSQFTSSCPNPARAAPLAILTGNILCHPQSTQSRSTLMVSAWTAWTTPSRSSWTSIGTIGTISAAVDSGTETAALSIASLLGTPLSVCQKPFSFGFGY